MFYRMVEKRVYTEVFCSGRLTVLTQKPKDNPEPANQSETSILKQKVPKLYQMIFSPDIKNIFIDFS